MKREGELLWPKCNAWFTPFINVPNFFEAASAAKNGGGSVRELFQGGIWGGGINVGGVYLILD